MNEMYETRVCLPVATAVALLISFPFCQLRLFGDITIISLVSFAAPLVCLVLIMSASSHVQPDPMATRSFFPPLDAVDSLTSIGGFFFASGGGQCAFFEYLTEMERPSDYPKTIARRPSSSCSITAPPAIMYQRLREQGARLPDGYPTPSICLDSWATRSSSSTSSSRSLSLNSALLRAFATHSVTDGPGRPSASGPSCPSSFSDSRGSSRTSWASSSRTSPPRSARSSSRSPSSSSRRYLLAASDASAPRDEEKTYKHVTETRTHGGRRNVWLRDRIRREGRGRGRGDACARRCASRS